MNSPFVGTTTLVGVIVAVGCGPTVMEVDDIAVEKDTLPEKSMKVLTVMVELADRPARTARLLGLALRLKLGDQ